MAKSGTPWSPISSSSATRAVVSLDVNALDPQIARLVHREFTGSILDTNLLERILSEFEVDLIFHLAALLSTRSEFTPMAAHHVNVEGTLNLLEFAAQETESHGRPVVFVYPVLHRRLRPARPRDPAQGRARSRGRLEQAASRCTAATSSIASILAATTRSTTSSCSRRGRRASISAACGFPGLISAVTVPSGGTSDYASEMIHAAARGEPYACFVRPDSRIPFMAMPDAIEALLKLSIAQPNRLSSSAYNVRAFNPSADEIRASALRAFPDAKITYNGRCQAAGASSIRGPRTSTTRRRAATGTLRRPTTSIARFTST